MDNDFTQGLRAARTTTEILNLIGLVDSDLREIKRMAALLLEQKKSPIQQSRLASLKIESNDLIDIRGLLTTKQRLVKKSEAMARKALNESTHGFLAAFLESAGQLLSKKEFNKIKKHADDKLLETRTPAQTES